MDDIKINTINARTGICSFEDARGFFKFNIPQILFVGSPVYQLATEELYIVVSRTNEGGTLVPFDAVRAVNFRPVPFIFKEVIKAYNSTELGLMLPHEFIAPINTVRGWAWMGNDGGVILKDTFYKTEVEARAKLLLYFLDLTIIELSDILDTWEKNLKLLT